VAVLQNSRFTDVCNDLERGLDAIFLNLATLYSLGIVLAGESEDVERVFASNSHQLAAV
jgi:hypothetical protein